eukprot:658385-Amphidinium_carterae.2
MADKCVVNSLTAVAMGNMSVPFEPASKRFNVHSQNVNSSECLRWVSIYLLIWTACMRPHAVPGNMMFFHCRDREQSKKRALLRLSSHKRMNLG